MTSLRPFLFDDIYSVVGKLSFRLIAVKIMHCLSGKIWGTMVKDVICNMEVERNTSRWKPEYRGK